MPVAVDESAPGVSAPPTPAPPVTAPPLAESRTLDEIGTSEPVAAVDLGSNSFHMLVAQVVDGELRLVDRLRERVALASGLDEEKRLGPEATDRALGCLGRFGQRLAGFPKSRVRAVGTNTLRQARNGRELLERAESHLGHPIEVISGKEEARLIYSGVVMTHPATPERRLVVDIGGGSTECIAGRGVDILEADSLFMGCLSYSMRYFPGGEITRPNMDAAMLAASLEVKTLERRYRAVGWDVALGSSGTVLAIADAARAITPDELGVTPRALRKLRKQVIASGSVDRLAIPTLQEDRKPVLPGGLAILSAIFDVLGLETMLPSQGALREGVIYDLLGRIRHVDVREVTIEQFAQRFGVDRDHAARVERTALALLDQVADPWQLDVPGARDFLRWGARLHEIGLSLSYSGYHRHGAYLLENADMAGFSRDDQRMLAALVGAHRRKIRPSLFEALPGPRAERVLRLALVLRLAARLERERTDRPTLPVQVAVKKRAIQVAFPPGFLAESPLTRADLEADAEFLSEVGYKFQVVEAAPPRPGVTDPPDRPPAKRRPGRGRRT